MGKYIALVGEDHRSAVNSLWAVLREGIFEPEELYIILDAQNGSSEQIKNDVKELLKNHDLNCSIEMNTFSEINDVRRMIDGSSENNSAPIALDISAASKLTTAEVLMGKGCDLFDHIFYLEVQSEDRDLPLPTIEQNKIRLNDLRAEETEVK